MATATAAEFREKLEKFHKLFKKEFPKIYGKFNSKIKDGERWYTQEEFQELKRKGIVGDVKDNDKKISLALDIEDLNTHLKKEKEITKNILKKIDEGKINVCKEVNELRNYLFQISSYMDFDKFCDSSELKELVGYFQKVTKIKN